MCIVSFHEQAMGCISYINSLHSQGVAGFLRGYGLMSTMTSTYQTIPILGFDAAAGGVYSRLLSSYPRIGRMDLRIAAIALANNMSLLTRNRADFAPIAALTVDDWIT